MNETGQTENHSAAGASSVSAVRRILVVDDHPDAAELLLILLREGGHEVQAAHDGPTALQRVRNMRPEIVILDLGLPGMDGFELAAKLRAEHGSSVFLVALTGYCHEEHRSRALESGFDRHFVKPPGLPELMEVLRSVTAL